MTIFPICDFMINIYPDQPLLPEDQVRELFREVQLAMSERFHPSLTELYFPNPAHPDVLENGTGSFVDSEGTKFLVSNEHVILRSGLEHSMFGCGVLLPVEPQRYTIPAPYDVGAAKVNNHTWGRYGHNARSISLSQFAPKHETVPSEILWRAGYPGARVRQYDRSVFAVCEAVPTQEYIFHDGTKPHEQFDSNVHFAVYYNPQTATHVFDDYVSRSPGLSLPPGLSGSLVWNTRRIECFHANIPWSADHAVVTGIVWGWPNSDYLIATKVEHLREFLQEVAELPDAPI